MSTELTDAQRRLVEAHMEWAVIEAKKYGRLCRWRFDLDDLTSAAYLALVEAAQRFDPLRGFVFKTYARWLVMRQFTLLHEHWGRANGWRYDHTRQQGRMAKVLRRVSWPSDLAGPWPAIETDIEREQRLRLVLSRAKTARERIILDGLLKGLKLHEIGRPLGLRGPRVHQLKKPLLARLAIELQPQSRC